MNSNYIAPPIHVIEGVAAALQSLASCDWWAPTADDLERLAQAVLGTRDDGWVRQGGQFVIIANQKLSSLASRLVDDLAALHGETKKILEKRDCDAPLRAAAFFHLRFENIHPLREGNGRVGRIILAAQLRETCGMPVDEILSQIKAHENNYKMVFSSSDPNVMFEVLVDFLAMLTGQTLDEGSAKLPTSILPLYPDRRSLIKSSSQQKRPLPPARSPQKNNYFRKFG